VDALAGVAGAIARGIRASLRFDAARRETGVEAPGLVVLGPRDEIELITPPARELLVSMRPDRPQYTDDAVATPVLALASFVRGTPDGGLGGSNVVTVPGSDGWITLHASLPGPAGDRRVAVVLERALDEYLPGGGASDTADVARALRPRIAARARTRGLTAGSIQSGDGGN